jgi:membrane protease YdiL (CAAX protease family)
VVSLITFPTFFFGAFVYYSQVCALRWSWIPRFYRLICQRFAGPWSALRWRLPKQFARTAFAQVVVVALPEEYFFRGYLQTRFERHWPPRRRLFGGSIGWALVWTSLLFALAHVAVDFNALRLAVFFPSLAFGWLRSATGSILAGVFYHAGCNLVSEAVHTILF